MKKLNVINEKFGKLTVINEHSKTRNGHIRYYCKCECGNDCNVLLTHLRQGKTKDCGCIKKGKIGKNHPQWTGHEEISGLYWTHIIRSANGSKRRKIEFNITIEYAWELFLEQNRKCELSGLEIYFPKSYNGKGTSSLDRIDSSKGYIVGNIQWVHKDINLMKNKLNQEYFINMCKIVSKNN